MREEFFKFAAVFYPGLDAENSGALGGFYCGIFCFFFGGIVRADKTAQLTIYAVNKTVLRCINCKYDLRAVFRLISFLHDRQS